MENSENEPNKLKPIRKSFFILILVFVLTSFFVFKYSSNPFARLLFFTLISFPWMASAVGMRIFSKTKIRWIFLGGLVGILLLIFYSNLILRDVKIGLDANLIFYTLILTNGFSLSLLIITGVSTYFNDNIEKISNIVKKSVKSESNEISQILNEKDI